MEHKRSYKYHVEPREADLTKRLTLAGLSDCLLNVACSDAKLSGYGSNDLGPNAGWVILRMGLEVTRLPEELEDITIATWVSDANRLATTRNFEVRDSSGAQIASAVSIWAALDLESRKPLNLNEFDFYSSAIQDFPMPNTPPERLTSPESLIKYTHQVLYSYVDANGHTYSINYLRMALDTLPLETITNHAPVRLDINFMHETRYGERLTIVSDGSPNPLFEILAADGTPACRIRIVWKPVPQNE